MCVWGAIIAFGDACIYICVNAEQKGDSVESAAFDDIDFLLKRGKFLHQKKLFGKLNCLSV
jgi:hypothetical protein